MKGTRVNIGRRNLLRMGSIALASSMIAGRSNDSYAQGAKGHVSETDLQAQTLGYENNANAVDKKKFTAYQPGEMCSKCNFFQGKPGAAWGPCTIFGGKEVNAKGWCSAFVAKKT